LLRAIQIVLTTLAGVFHLDAHSMFGSLLELFLIPVMEKGVAAKNRAAADGGRDSLLEPHRWVAEQYPGPSNVGVGDCLLGFHCGFTQRQRLPSRPVAIEDQPVEFLVRERLVEGSALAGRSPDRRCSSLWRL
jgi:hypothetical protein